jgi:hypothetical protein
MVFGISYWLGFYVLAAYLLGFAMFGTDSWLPAERRRFHRWLRVLSPFSVPWALLNLFKKEHAE